MQEINEIINAINEKFAAESWLDFEVISVRDGTLRLKASTDFSYYHLMEIELLEVGYFQGPLSWGSAPNERPLVQFLPDDEASRLVELYRFDSTRFTIAFNSDDNFRILIAANSIQVNFDVVYYYQRENLQANERIDEEVLKAANR